MSYIPSKHHLVHWIDGMKINKDHFVSSDNAFVDQIRDALSQNVHAQNYGLLPFSGFNGEGLKLFLELNQQSQLQVKVLECNAITQGGCRVEISEQAASQLEAASDLLGVTQQIAENETQTLWAVLTVNPFQRIPFGPADPEEDPPRHPYTIPEYKLDLIPDEQVGMGEMGLHHVTLGRIIIKDGEAVLDEYYIPPCTSVDSHPSLTQYHGELEKLMHNLEFSVLKVIQKIYQKRQMNDLAKIVLYLGEQMLLRLSEIIPDFKWTVKHEAPIHMITPVASLARLIKNTIDTRQGVGKEELLNYFTNWCDLNQAEFENALIDITGLQYDHRNLAEAAKKAKYFIQMIASLFMKLSELDYIGKRGDSHIFVKEELLKPEKVPTAKGSFLAD